VFVELVERADTFEEVDVRPLTDVQELLLHQANLAEGRAAVAAMRPPSATALRMIRIDKEIEL
jgi:hypothetical protein